MDITLKLTQREAEALRCLLVEGVLWNESVPEMREVHSKLVWSGDSSDWDSKFCVGKGVATVVERK